VEAAGANWKAAVYKQIEQEVKAARRLKRADLPTNSSEKPLASETER